jgi:shikimate kinase
LKNIVLAGFMGVGKTETGIALAWKMRRKFYDTDLIIESNEKTKVDKIISERGEPYFRAAEIDVFSTAINRLDAVFSTGGGTLLNPGLMALAREKTTTVFLFLSVPSMLKRIRHLSEIRPLLRGKTTEEIVAMYERRMRIYEKCEIHVDTEGLNPTQVAGPDNSADAERLAADRNFRKKLTVMPFYRCVHSPTVRLLSIREMVAPANPAFP